MDVSDESDERDEQARAAAAKPPEPGQRKKRSDAGKPRGSSGRPSSRFERRAAKAKVTVRELVRLRLPQLDTSGLSFAETVERDADAWGEFLAQLGEWFVPFGAFLDLVFGAGLIRVLRVAPSFRAGRRELVERRQRIAAERQEAAEDAELRERIATEHEAARSEGVFGDLPTEPEPAPVGMTREEWLANGGAGA